MEADQGHRAYEKTAERAERENIANLLRWRFEEEHASHLTRPEIARYVVYAAKELADLLGISLGEEASKGSSSL
jgi:hypothetical protein